MSPPSQPRPHFVILEAHRLARYRELDWSFSYLRTKDDAEIDLIIERPGMPAAILEIESTRSIQERDAAPLARFVPAFGKCEALCLSRDPRPKKFRDVWCLPWQEGLARLGL